MSKTFAANLRAYRALAHMTQTDLAKAAGITRAMVNNYEQATSEPSFEALCRIATVLGVDVTDLIREGEIPDYVRKVQVTDDEAGLLQAYREAEPVYRTVAVEILRTHKKGGLR